MRLRRALFFSISPVFVPAKVLHERLLQYFPSILFVLLDPPLRGPALLRLCVPPPGDSWGVAFEAPGASVSRPRATEAMRVGMSADPTAVWGGGGDFEARGIDLKALGD